MHDCIEIKLKTLILQSCKEVRIYEMEHCSEAVAAAVNRLLQQLGRSARLAVGAGFAVDDGVGRHASVPLEAEDGIAAMATLAFYTSPTGRKAWIEDVVVDESCRGRGFGKLIVQYAIDFARRSSGCKLMLTSRPSRVAANRMYASLGFERRETNVYLMRL